MANNAILNNVYNQYLTTYAPQKSNSRYDTHKRSELKNVYNSMVKVNRDAPLYKFNNSKESTEYVIGLKEESRVLHNGFAAVVGDGKGNGLGSNIAYSTNDSIVSAAYVGEGETGTVEDNVQFSIEVKETATPQVNLGLFLPKDERGITPGPYAFDVTVGNQTYEFQYSIKEEETNNDVQNKLSRLINNAGIGLSSTVEEDDEGNSALRIESDRHGTGPNNESMNFKIEDSSERRVSGSVAYLGIDYVAREAKNASLLINGQEVSSASNTFILNQKYEITINGISPEPGVAATVGMKPDTEAAIDNITGLIDTYNKFVNTMKAYSSVASRNNGLMMEMNSIVRSYSSDMNKMGISLNESGNLELDVDSLKDAISDSYNPEAYDTVKAFSASVIRKSNQISLNPVAYMDKTVVAYKNPGRNYTSPYTASAYSGLLFNSYC